MADGDFNGDGKPDLAVISFYSGAVSVLLGNGDGTFTAHPGFSNTSNSGVFAVGDLNGDGITDLVVNAYGSFVVALGNGDGTFQAPQTFGTYNLAPSDAIQLSDLNGDRRPDVVVAANAFLNIFEVQDSASGGFLVTTIKENRSAFAAGAVRGFGCYRSRISSLS